MKGFACVDYLKKDLIRLNYVCKYLKVVSLVDIATIDGTSISSILYICPEGNGL